MAYSTTYFSSNTTQVPDPMNPSLFYAPTQQIAPFSVALAQAAGFTQVTGYPAVPDAMFADGLARHIPYISCICGEITR